MNAYVWVSLKVYWCVCVQAHRTEFLIFSSLSTFPLSYTYVARPNVLPPQLTSLLPWLNLLNACHFSQASLAGQSFFFSFFFFFYWPWLTDWTELVCWCRPAGAFRWPAPENCGWNSKTANDFQQSGTILPHPFSLLTLFFFFFFFFIFLVFIFGIFFRFLSGLVIYFYTFILYFF